MRVMQLQKCVQLMTRSNALRLQCIHTLQTIHVKYGQACHTWDNSKRRTQYPERPKFLCEASLQTTPQNATLLMALSYAKVPVPAEQESQRPLNLPEPILP